jgi:uncharacterized protein
MQGHDEAHGLPHAVRVACLALEISSLEGYARDDLVVAASLLHDVGRGLEEEVGIHHALISASIARRLLRYWFSENDVDIVARAIEEHSFSLGRRPSTKLSCIISDADKLDAVGAIGVARALIHGCMTGRRLIDTLRHYKVKLSRLGGLLCLNSSRALLGKRMEVMRMFFEALEAELASYIDSEKAVENALGKALTTV